MKLQFTKVTNVFLTPTIVWDTYFHGFVLIWLRYSVSLTWRSPGQYAKQVREEYRIWNLSKRRKGA